LFYKKIPLKSVFTYFLLLIFLFNILFFYPVFLFFQYEIKSESANYKETETNTTEISVYTEKQSIDNKWEWVDKNEFRCKGQMYDVIKIEKTKETILYYCKTDHFEMKLFESLNHFICSISNIFGSGKKETKKPLKEYFKDYFSVKNEIVLFSLYDTDLLLESYSLFRLYNPETLLPPPKVV
jgi:hypothetical protein